MIVSIHQPAYLPWLGYLDRIRRSDAFVFLDTVQFEKNSYANRNRIKSSEGPLWVTVPVRRKGHLSSTLEQLQIDGQKWRRKHINSIRHAYAKAPHFASRFPKIERLLSTPFPLLAEMCWEHLSFWLKELEITTRTLRASSLPVKSSKSALVLEICRHLTADTYLSGPRGRDYLELDAFARAGIEVLYHDFHTPRYPQLHGGFEPDLSVVDAWMNCDVGSLLRTAAAAGEPSAKERT